jgi:hypothetical protein
MTLTPLGAVDSARCFSFVVAQAYREQRLVQNIILAMRLILVDPIIKNASMAVIARNHGTIERFISM